MTLGKALRLRRIFGQARALVVDCHSLREDPIGWVRLLARSGADAAILSPGLLDAAAEELGGLAVVLRLDAGAWLAQPLISVQAALEMGAEAVALSVTRTARESLERFGRVSEEARRLGMPLLAEVAGEDWKETARLTADYGADLIAAPYRSGMEAWQQWPRAAGKPLLAMVDFPASASSLLDTAWQVMQGPAQGILLGPPPWPYSESGPVFAALHALVHQDISIEEARRMAGLPPAEP